MSFRIGQRGPVLLHDCRGLGQHAGFRFVFDQPEDMFTPQRFGALGGHRRILRIIAQQYAAYAQVVGPGLQLSLELFGVGRGAGSVQRLRSQKRRK